MAGCDRGEAMNVLGGRVRKLEDRFEIGNETIGQMHIRALQEAEHQRLAKAGELAEVDPPDSE